MTERAPTIPARMNVPTWSQVRISRLPQPQGSGALGSLLQPQPAGNDAVDDALRQGVGYQSLERVWRHRVAGFRPRGRERDLHRLAQLFRRQTPPAIRDHVGLEPGEGPCVRGVSKFRDVDGIGGVPDRRGYGAGGDYDHIDAKRQKLAAERFRHPFESELRGAVGAEKWGSVPPSDRGNHHDTSRGALAGTVGTEQRREGLCDDQMADDVDANLQLEVVDLLIEQGARHGDAGIVDQSEQRLAA